jgi:hypothetical protein
MTILYALYEDDEEYIIFSILTEVCHGKIS